MAEAAATAGVDRTTVVRIRQVAKDGALSALAESRPGIKAGTRDVELDAAKAEIARLSETVKEMAVKLMLVEGKAVGDRWPRPRRVDAATKTALLELLNRAVEQGWSVSAAAVVLDLGRVRAHRWMLCAGLFPGMSSRMGCRCGVRPSSMTPRTRRQCGMKRELLADHEPAAGGVTRRALSRRDAGEMVGDQLEDPGSAPLSTEAPENLGGEITLAVSRPHQRGHDPRPAVVSAFWALSAE